MARIGWFIVPVVAIALLIGGAFGAAVVNHDTEHADRVVQITAPPADSSGAPQVIAIDRDNDHWRGGFFPFGFIFPLLWIGLIIFLFSAFFRRGRGGWGGPGGWGGGPGRWNDRFEEWHRRQHDGDGPSTPGPAATA